MLFAYLPKLLDRKVILFLNYHFEIWEIFLSPKQEQNPMYILETTIILKTSLLTLKIPYWIIIFAFLLWIPSTEIQIRFQFVNTNGYCSISSSILSYKLCYCENEYVTVKIIASQYACYLPKWGLTFWRVLRNVPERVVMQSNLFAANNFQSHHSNSRGNGYLLF